MENKYHSGACQRLLRGPAGALLLALGLAATAQAQTTSFAAMTTYPVGATDNYYAAVGDLNGDGVPDIVSSNLNGGSGTVSVLLGRAAGGFAPAVGYAIGGYAEELALADLNNDGRLDVVVPSSSAIKVLLGTGTGTLGTVASYPTGVGNGFSMKLYDVTRDGILDVVTANIDNTVSVLPGTAAGTFGVATSYTVGSSLRGLSVGDFNRDNRADLAVSDANSTNVYVLLGQATGFAPPATYATGQASYFLETADLDRDGQLDIIVSGDRTSTIKVLTGNANGTFNPAVAYTASTTSAFLTGLTTGDVNGDGYTDVLVGDTNLNKAYVLPGSSTGTLGAPVPFAVGSFVYDLLLADLNRDGRPDLVAANGGDGTVGVLLNTSPSFAAPVLTTLNPKSGLVGTSVTITGTALTGTSSVSFNGTLATSFSVPNSTTVIATVPGGATTGLVRLAVGGQVSNGLSFTVTASAPTVTTAAPANVTSSGAQLGGAVTFDNGTAVTERGVVYSATNQQPTLADTKVASGAGVGSFSQAVSGLAPATTYYARAYATNTTGTAYGSMVSFTTLRGLAALPALAAADVTLHPNPAHESFTVTLPAVAGASAVQAELLNTLGQVVRRQQAALPASGATLRVPTSELAAGVYVLRLTAGAASLTRRVVVQ